jgi:hypothetical protein
MPFTYARRVTGHSGSWLGSALGLVAIGLGLAGITASAILAFVISSPRWIPPSVLATTVVVALGVGSRRAWYEEHDRAETLSRQPLDSRHEAELREGIDQLLTHPGNLDAKARMLIADLQSHHHGHGVWKLRDELFETSARHQETAMAYDAQLTSELDRLDFGPYRQWVAQIVMTQPFNMPSDLPSEYPPWYWSCAAVVGNASDLRLANWPIARVATMDEALTAYEKVLHLWREVPRWETTKATRTPDQRLLEVRKLLETEVADVKLATLSGTGPCAHC